ncbi:MAG: PC4/YdbC family ssDNA-binding protein [Candidatus Omnitrophota bacterium]
METATAVQNEQTQNVVLCDVPKSGNDVYRISRNVYKGERYVDIRIFFRSKADTTLLVPTTKGVCFPEKIREDIIAGLIFARKASGVECPKGEQFRSVKVCEVPISATEHYRISKGAGSKNAYVDIRKFFQTQKDGAFVPSKTKGVSILEGSLDEVIMGLMRTESEHAA